MRQMVPICRLPKRWRAPFDLTNDSGQPRTVRWVSPQILFGVWSTFREQKWVNSRECRGPIHTTRVSPLKSSRSSGCASGARTLQLTQACIVPPAPTGPSPLAVLSHESATAAVAARDLPDHNRARTARARAGLVLLTQRTRRPSLRV